MRSPNNWTLSYSGLTLPFGSIASGYVFNNAPDLGTAEFETDDATRPRGDGVLFGVDTFGGRTVSFDLTVNGTDEADVKDRLAVLTRAWRADVVRSDPGATATLKSDTGRVAFGRPRRFAPNLDLLPFGVSEVLADFATGDTLWYDGTENACLVTLVPPPSGGLMAPLASPLATTQSSDRSRGFTIGGDLPTWPVFEIKGPIVNPVIEVVGKLKMEFSITLAYDQKLVIDTRPWARSILRNGASVAGTITRTSTRLAKASLAPGSYELVLRGTADLGSPSANIRWRSAYTTP